MMALCLACSPVTLNSSGQDGGDTKDAASETDGRIEPLCQTDGSEDSCSTSDLLHQCNPAGVFEDITCRFGCSNDTKPHCRELQSGLTGAPISELCGETAAFAPQATLRFDTMTGSITNLDTQAVIRPAGTGIEQGIGFAIFNQGQSEVGIFSFASLTLPPGLHEVRGTRAAGLASCGPMSINGVLLAAANRTMPGPGGGPSDNAGTGGPGVGGDAVASPVNQAQGGGGGGGHGGAGGGGGGGAAAGGTSGIVFGNSTLLPLVGGSAGGKSGGGSLGGAGGGAIYLGSGVSISFTGQGGVNAGGGGGQVDGPLQGGGGGGSGGGILLEAPTISLVGGATLAANGGGGADSDAALTAGMDGQLGLGAAGPTRGGAADAADGDIGAVGGGGGGGAAGRIRLVSESGVDLTDAVLSPSPAATNSVGETLLSQGTVTIK